MFRVDVDAHVDESEATWEYLDDGARRFKPVTLDPGAATAPGDARPHRLWVIDGNIRLRRWRDDKRTGTVQANARAYRRGRAHTPYGRAADRCAGALPDSISPCAQRSPGGRAGALQVLQSLDRQSHREEPRPASLGRHAAAALASTKRSRRCAGRRTTALAAYSRRVSNAATAPPAIRTSFPFTKRRAASTCPSASTTRRAKSSPPSRSKERAWTAA